MEPIQFTWFPPVSTDASGSEAVNVAVGTYKVRAVDANDEKAEVVVKVIPRYEFVSIVKEYQVHHASTGTSHDGSIEAIGEGMDEPGLRFHWSNGVQTKQPVLMDVPCGTYVMTCTHETKPVTCVHEACIATVGIRV